MSEHDEKRQNFFAWAGSVVAAAKDAALKDGTIVAIGREAVKETHATLMDVFFGQKEGPGEPGTPLCPTQGEVAADRKDAFSTAEATPSASNTGEAATQNQTQATDPNRFSSQPQTGKGFVEKLLAKRSAHDEGGNASGGQNEQNRERNLPQEQAQQREERGGRGR